MSSSDGKFIKGIVDGHPVVVFSKTTCSYCRLAKKSLEEVGVAYHIEDIDGKENMTGLQDKFEKLTGERTVSNAKHCSSCL